jgi:hypothetical protein
MKPSALKRDEKENTLHAVQSFFVSKHDHGTESAYSRVIKLISEHLAVKDIHIEGEGLTDPELLMAVYKEIIAKVSGAKAQRYTMILEGMRRFSGVIEQAGGVYSAAEVAQLMGISDTAVRKKLERNQLLAIERGKRAYYPVWQFTGNQVTPGLEKVLDALKGVSPVMRVQFLLGTDAEYQTSRIEHLQSAGVDEVLLRKARQLGKQGAR